MPASSLSQVSAGVYAVLNVSAMTALATGGVGDDLAQRTSTASPFLWIEVANESAAAARGFGTKPGTVGRLLEIDLRLHAFFRGESKKVGQDVIKKAIELLADPPAVTGFNSWAIFHDDTLTFDQVDIAGEKQTEIVAMLRLYVEEAA